jgi:hypothetical protein
LLLSVLVKSLLLASEAGSTVVAEVTLVVHLIALAGNTRRDRFVVFSIKAANILLATGVGHLLSKEAFIVCAVTAVIRGPLLKV